MANLLTASEAAKRLGVSRQTLYAYVSRGLIRAMTPTI
jgi:citrate synthase